MPVFYLSSTGVHSSVLAAAIHLGLIQPGNRITAHRLRTLPMFGAVLKATHFPLLLGRDAWGATVYALQGAGELQVVARIVNSLGELYHLPAGQMRVVDLGYLEDLTLRLGVRLTHLPVVGQWLGIHLIAYSLRRSQPRLLQHVRQVKQGLAHRI